MILLQHGYQFHFVTSKKKDSIRETPFFVWNEIIMPNGQRYSIRSEKELTKIINKINTHLVVQRELIVTREFIQHQTYLSQSSTTYLQQRLSQYQSVFHPIVDTNLYSIIVSSSYQSQ